MWPHPLQTIMNPAAPLSKTLAAWKYFEVDKDELNFAEFKLRKAKLARGGTNSSSFNMSKLRKHLQVKHEDGHKEVEAVLLETRTLLQATLWQTLHKTEKLRNTNPRALQITRVLAEMIALANLPLSFVENVGFQRFMKVEQRRL